MSFESFLSQLNVTATSPYAFFAYLCLIAENMFIAWKIISNKTARTVIEKLPEEKRAEALRDLVGVPIPDNISAEEWLKGRTHFYALLAFLTVIICLTAVAIIAIAQQSTTISKSGWKSEDKIKQITYNTNRGYVVSIIGQGKQYNVSEQLSSPFPITVELYSDPAAEMLLFYKDKRVVGRVFRTLEATPFPVSILETEHGKKWKLGAGKFSELDNQPQETFERDFNGKSICRIERHYFGAPDYEDFYFSYNFSRNTEDTQVEKMRPDSLMIIDTDEICGAEEVSNDRQECEGMLRMFACTPASDAI